MGPAVRAGAASALGGIGPDAHEATGALVGLFDDKEGRVRRSAAFAVGEIGASPAPIAALITLLKDPEMETRIAAVVALGRIGPEAKAAVEPLRQILKDGNPQGRLTAAVALGRIGLEARAAASDVAALLTSSDRTTQRAAVAALIAIGKGAVPALINALKDEDPRTRRAPPRRWAQSVPTRRPPRCRLSIF